MNPTFPPVQIVVAGSSRKPLAILFVVAFGLIAATIGRAGENAAPFEEVNLVAMGDWAASGNSQAPVAKALGAYVSGSGRRFDGILTAGDNFYSRLKSVDDPQWDKYFESMYDRRLLNIPFFPSLGNHDYVGSQDSIEIDYSTEHPQSRWKMPALVPARSSGRFAAAAGDGADARQQ